MLQFVLNIFQMMKKRHREAEANRQREADNRQVDGCGRSQRRNQATHYSLKYHMYDRIVYDSFVHCSVTLLLKFINVEMVSAL